VCIGLSVCFNPSPPTSSLPPAVLPPALSHARLLRLPACPACAACPTCLHREQDLDESELQDVYKRTLARMKKVHLDALIDLTAEAAK
jgi:hypothetical protein